MSAVTPRKNDAAGGTGQGKVFGMVAELDTPHDLLEAVKAVRKAGFSRIDTHTPFPIHGIDTAIKLPNNKLP